MVSRRCSVHNLDLGHLVESDFLCVADDVRPVERDELQPFHLQDLTTFLTVSVQLTQQFFPTYALASGIVISYSSPNLRPASARVCSS